VVSRQGTEDRQPADWDPGAQPYLETFLTTHTPYQGALPTDDELTQVLTRRALTRRGKPTCEGGLTDDELTQALIRRALTRRGKPTWSEEDFQQLLLYTLGCAGYGWLRPEGVRRELERMAATWKEPPPLM
jgi:hypothetical protein